MKTQRTKLLEQKLRRIIREEVSRNLHEGTWNINRKRALEVIKQLKQISEDSFDIIGDDDFHDLLESAIIRAEKLTKTYRKTS